jgi:hypothetical protein
MKTPVKFPAASTDNTFSKAPLWVCHTEGNKPCAEAVAADARRKKKAAMTRDI